MAKLKGKNALVTGGAGLLGQAFARALGEEGAMVWIQDIDYSRAERVAEMLNSEGIAAKPLRGDITDPVEIGPALGHMKTKSGGHLDIAVLSAAINPQPDESGGHLESYPLDTFRKSIEVNLTGTFAVCQKIASMMPSGASITTIGSTYGLVSPDQRMYGQNRKPPDYTASKAGVIGLTKWLAVYLAPKGIRVNCLIPGGVENGQHPYFIDEYSRHTPMGRMAQPEEIAQAVVFLATASYMTGTNLVIDGGWTAW